MCSYAHNVSAYIVCRNVQTTQNKTTCDLLYYLEGGTNFHLLAILFINFYFISTIPLLLSHVYSIF